VATEWENGILLFENVHREFHDTSSVNSNVILIRQTREYYTVNTYFLREHGKYSKNNTKTATRENSLEPKVSRTYISNVKTHFYETKLTYMNMFLSYDRVS
jgi:hypothetical protein